MNGEKLMEIGIGIGIGIEIEIGRRKVEKMEWEGGRKGKREIAQKKKKSWENEKEEMELNFE